MLLLVHDYHHKNMTIALAIDKARLFCDFLGSGLLALFTAYVVDFGIRFTPWRPHRPCAQSVLGETGQRGCTPSSKKVVNTYTYQSSSI